MLQKKLLVSISSTIFFCKNNKFVPPNCENRAKKWLELLTVISGKAHAQERHSRAFRGTPHSSAGSWSSADPGSPWSSAVENGGVDGWNVEGPCTCSTPRRHLCLSLTIFGQSHSKILSGKDNVVLLLILLTLSNTSIYFSEFLLANLGWLS
jgi:hypothetical protein